MYQQTTIKNINTFIVDPHNEVLPFWYYLNKIPSILIHIDDHTDMASGVETFENAKKSHADIMTLEDYAKESLDLGDFICAAIYNNQVKVVYHLAPRRHSITAYGQIKRDRIIGALKTTVNNSGIIEWENNELFPDYKKISEKELIRDFESITRPIILDIDLDAFHSYWKDSLNESYLPRIEKIRKVLNQLPKPSLITIAKSQTPNVCATPHFVKQMEEDCISMLKKIY